MMLVPGIVIMGWLAPAKALRGMVRLVPGMVMDGCCCSVSEGGAEKHSD